MSDLLEFRHFRYLIAVAEEQNITRAAKRLFVAQPSLSAQLKSMEESLLVDLLVRDRKGIKLTPAAEVLTAGARQILALRDDVIAAARASHNVAIAPLRIGFSPFVDRALLQMVCGAHTDLFPDSEIMPKSGDHVELLSLVERGLIDAALVTLPAEGMGLNMQPLAQDRLVVCMKSNDPAAKQDEIAPSALGKKLTIFREPRQHPEAHRRLIEMLSEVGVHQQATFEDIEAEIGEAVNFIVHVERQPGRRAIREVLRLDGYDRQAQEFRFEMVYDSMDSSIKGDLILA
jgi:DNA-binding transcriptional LysR family regulator